MSHSECTLTPPTEDWGHKLHRGNWTWLLSVHCLFKKHPMRRRKKRGPKNIPHIGRNLWPQAQNESMERHCFVRTTEILWKTNLLSASSADAGSEPIQCGPRARTTSSTASAKLPVSDAQLRRTMNQTKSMATPHFPLTESIIQRHNWRKDN